MITVNALSVREAERLLSKAIRVAKWDDVADDGRLWIKWYLDGKLVADGYEHNVDVYPEGLEGPKYNFVENYAHRLHSCGLLMGGKRYKEIIAAGHPT